MLLLAVIIFVVSQLSTGLSCLGFADFEQNDAWSGERPGCSLLIRVLVDLRNEEAELIWDLAFNDDLTVTASALSLDQTLDWILIDNLQPRKWLLFDYFISILVVTVLQGLSILLHISCGGY